MKKRSLTKMIRSLTLGPVIGLLAACSSSDGNNTRWSSQFNQNSPSSHFISLVEKGVAGDGVTDDTVALQRVLDEAPTNATIVFEDRSYVIKSSLKVRVRGLKLQGPGRLRMKGGAQYAALEIESNDVVIDSLRIQNVDEVEPGFIQNACGDGKSQGTKHIIGARVKSSGIKIMRSRFEGLSYGVILENGVEHRIEDNHITSLKGINAQCDGGAGVLVKSSFTSIQGNLIEQNDLKASEGGIIVIGPQAIRNDISRNEIKGNFIHALVVNNEIPVEENTNVNPTNLVYLNTIASNGILISQTRNTDVFDNKIVFQQGSFQTTAAIKVWNSRNSQVLRNDIYFPSGSPLTSGLWAYQVPGLLLNHNRFLLETPDALTYPLEQAARIEFSNDAHVNFNLVAQGVASIGFKIKNSPRLLMTGKNRFRDVQMTAIHLENSVDAEMRALDIHQSGTAVSLSSSPRALIKNSVFSEVDRGLKLIQSPHTHLSHSEVSYFEEETDMDEASEESFISTETEWTFIGESED